jgi:hypothetical protein
MVYGVGIFAELADNRLYGCSPVVGFIKPKKLGNTEYKLCLNRGTIVHILDSMGSKTAEPKSFKNGASQGSIGYNSEKTVIVLLNCKT